MKSFYFLTQPEHKDGLYTDVVTIQLQCTTVGRSNNNIMGRAKIHNLHNATVKRILNKEYQLRIFTKDALLIRHAELMNKVVCHVNPTVTEK